MIGLRSLRLRRIALEITLTIHTLRHCFATHLLEAGVNLRQIQKYLGHATLQTSTIYLHLTTVGEEAAIAKLKRLMDEERL